MPHNNNIVEKDGKIGEVVIKNIAEKITFPGNIPNHAQYQID